MKESNLMTKEEKKEVKKQEKFKRKEEKDFKKEIKKEEKLNKKNNIKTPWLKYYKDVPSHLNYPKGTMVGYFLEAVARFPEDIAIEYYGRTYTYRAF